jgi:DNA-binding response OmpR family regulator
LLIDGDPALCAFLSHVLEDACNSVELAPDGSSALAMLAASSPDLLITTRCDAGLGRMECFLAGALDIATDSDHRFDKPFDIDHLLAIVARLLAGIPSDPTP